MASISSAINTNTTLTAEYTYTDDLLTSLETNSTNYSFTYGDFALRSAVKIGSRTLAEYSYTTRNKYLDTLEYGNEDSVEYSYDTQGRVTQQTYEDGDTVTYQYDNSGALATVTDSATGITTTYYYDFTDRMMKYVESSNDHTHSVTYGYDNINNLSSIVETINGITHTTGYAYDRDNRVTSVSYGDSSVNYTYDAYGRISQQISKKGSSAVATSAYTYLDVDEDGTQTSQQVATLRNSIRNRDTTYTYTYDGNGNITSIHTLWYNPLIRDEEYIVRNFSEENTTQYVYDSQNQLIRENNQVAGKTWVWEYDNAGNILKRTEYSYTNGTLGTVLDTVAYTYGDSGWGDLLTSYDGNTITYDTIGNPLSDGTWTYTWEHGRELASMSDGETTWTYTYDANGMRTSRSDGTTTYKYIYNGDKLVQMTVGDDVLYFSYDAAGRPATVTYNDEVYYYVTNLQGDVIWIVADNGYAFGEYSYDAWGNVSVEGTGILELNPLRYRGYVYDSESGLYYLQSRYYDPEVGRFLNADAFASTGQGLLGNNMFAYCGNNPVIRIDPNGCLPQWLNHFCQEALNFLDKLLNTLVKSSSVSGEIGYGFGAKGKIGTVSIDATAVILGDVWTNNFDGTSESIRRSSLTVQAEILDNVSVGGDLQYYAPLEACKGTGLLDVDEGQFDITVGAYAFNYGLGYKTISTQDVEFSFGFSLYFVMGGGGEFSINISDFIEIWNAS